MSELMRKLKDIRGSGVYYPQRLDLDLGTARADVKFNFVGSFIFVESLDGSCAIKLNEQNSSEVNLIQYQAIAAPFDKIYVTNSAQSGKTCKLLIADETFFRCRSGVISDHGLLTNVTADQHHPSGNIKDYTLGLKTGIKAGTSITIDDSGDGYARINSSASGGGICKIAHDYPERNITETAETTIHDIYVIQNTAQETNFTTLVVQAEGYSATGLTTYVKIYEGANLLITLSWTETAATIKTGSYDISGWADGKHRLTAKVYISGSGTGRLVMIEYWVRK